jgi:heat shock protein HtpX
MLRIALFLRTNLAVIFLISLTFQFFGFEGLLQQNGIDLNITALMIYSSLFGFAGSLISLLLSKTMAKAAMRVRIITGPSNNMERWLVYNVDKQANWAGIETPEVGIFNSLSPNAFATGWNKNEALVEISTGL